MLPAEDAAALVSVLNVFTLYVDAEAADMFIEIVLALVEGVGDIVRGRARLYCDCDAITLKPETGES